jgi:hypothetical protein
MPKVLAPVGRSLQVGVKLLVRFTDKLAEAYIMHRSIHAKPVGNQPQDK